MSETIERLRAELAESDQVRRFTVDEVETVVAQLRDCRSLTEVAAGSNLDTDQVLEIVVKLGTWLTHVYRRPEVATLNWWETGQLFPDQDRDEEIVIPVGFERGAAHGRDVSKSLAAVVALEPSHNDITRWIARLYPSQTAVLTFPMVAIVWKFSRVGKLDEIDEASTARAFRRNVVDAHDLLDIAITDAQQALASLVGFIHADDDTVVTRLNELANVATTLSWLQPAEMAQLSRIVELTLENPTLVPSLTARLRTIGSLIEQDPAVWRVTEIGDLSQGQVEQVAARAGLQVEGVSRAEESAIRDRLTELGLQKDADQLVPEGVLALASGHEAAFWEAMTMRAKGDPAWYEILAAAYDD